MTKRKCDPIIVLFLFLFNVAGAQTFYDINTIQQINIHFSQPNWDYQMDTAKEGSEGYILADWVEINGSVFDSVGVKYKGNSSYDSTYIKNPLHIALDEFRDQSYEGYSDIKLGNGYADPSMIREVLAYSVLGNYMHCPLANYANVYINGNLIGLYSNVESINKKFCSDHFYSSGNTFVKCNPQITSPAFKSNLKYITADSSNYEIRYDLKSDFGWNELVALCDSLSNNPSSFNNVVDADRVIWMLAFNNVLVNLDSYSGAFAQNHYIYKDQTGHFNPVVWDLNMAFGGFAFAGSQGVGLGTIDTSGMRTLSPLLHATESDWPLIVNVLNDPMYKRMYIAHMQTIVNEMFAQGYYYSVATQLRGIINTSVQNDPNSFFSYSQFQNGLTDPVIVSSRVVPGISTLMDARITYLRSTPEFLLAPPVISGVTPSDTAPAYLAPFTIRANVFNADVNSVFLGYRFSNEAKFTRVLMYDDGAHNDGAAGDLLYGSSPLTMNAAFMQCYVYAENSDAGVFSPARAEHEFYTLNADIQTANSGEVVINEFLAVNQNDTVDNNGAHEDWIELYNTTSNPLNLFGLYMSDTYSNITKFSFPENSVIQPNGYLIIWADEDNSAAGELHCNFKLSANGESILLSNVNGNIFDSISFGAQAADVALARCPNATGPFLFTSTPTFGNSNVCTDGIEEIGPGAISIFPNPSSGTINIVSEKQTNFNYEILNSLGEIVISGKSQGATEINLSQLTPGFYIFRSDVRNKKIVISR